MPNNRIKILYVIDTLCMGGANKLTVETINLLNSRLFEKSLLMLGNYNTHNTFYLDNLSEDVKFIHINIFEYSFYNRIKRLKHLFSQYNIIHSCLELSNFYCGLVNLVMNKRVKFITTIHGTDGVFIKDKLLQEYMKNNLSKKLIFEIKYLQTLLFHFYKGFIAVSNNTRDTFSKTRMISASKIKVIKHGSILDEQYDKNKLVNKKEKIRNQLSIKKNNYVIGYVGRLTYGKGLEELIESFHELQNSIDNLVLLLVGDGENRANLEFIIKRLTLENRCFITGNVYNVDEYYEVFDLFVLPSYSESTSLVVQEAAFHEIPVLCSDAGALPEMIKDGVNGYIFKTGDFNMLKIKIRYIYENKNMLKYIIKKAKNDMLQEFNFKNNIFKIENYLKEIYINK